MILISEKFGAILNVMVFSCAGRPNSLCMEVEFPKTSLKRIT